MQGGKSPIHERSPQEKETQGTDVHSLEKYSSSQKSMIWFLIQLFLCLLQQSMTMPSDPRKSKLFRDGMCNPVLDSQASLQLRLEDFGTEAFAAKFPELTEAIHISAENLFTFLQRAEVKARRAKQGEGLVRSTKPWVRKRRRNSTPTEQLNSDRESEFAEQERRQAKKAMMDDGSYKASSSNTE
ncbi:hypothetical protein BKA65DRAFT_581321 [Rhexocercosporidium sp. MPI-PUGE-AT-0058]|nr:hypothetical protein BKA65DRAFT_581321 [Rhexocercosporidium sp. MPI-PUGE-AT-0058]